MGRARGDFVVTLTPQSTDEITGASTLARLAIDKQFTGDLIGVSKGEMLSAGTPTKGSAGYVAIERVSGALHGRTGTFVLQHSGTMTRGSPELTVSVVPDSGSGELTGLSGTMRIIIEGKRHSYEFDYTISIGMNV
ncbi:MAG TPA: DUF3224 domain-containing protein [Gemmatimonadaceae bacterium]|jgi:hypothetical protein|nr:DUF3224 domain-containing protein [Gemmatimonadaceae bacterium]